MQITHTLKALDLYMRDFYFEQSYEGFLARDKTKIVNASIIIMLLFFIYLLAAFFDFGKAPDVLDIVLVFLLIISLLYFDYSKRRNFRYSPDERWVVSLIGSHLCWLSPPTMVKSSNEISFDIDISEIDEIQKSFSDRNDSSPYTFFLKSGAKINPGINSSIEMDELIEIIKGHGIKLKHVSDFSK